MEERQEGALTTFLLWVQELGSVLLVGLSQSKKIIAHIVPPKSKEAGALIHQLSPLMGRGMAWAENTLRHREAGSHWPGWHLSACNFQNG